MNPGRVKVPYYALRRGGMLKINTPARVLADKMQTRASS